MIITIRYEKTAGRTNPDYRKVSILRIKITIKHFVNIKVYIFYKHIIYLFIKNYEQKTSHENSLFND